MVSKLRVKKKVRDLGVIVSTDHNRNLSFSEHCNKIAHDAARRGNLIYKAFATRNRDFLMQMYKTFVRPKIEYASPVWNPHLVRDIKVLESVQRQYTIRIPGMAEYRGFYGDRLKQLQLETVEHRRLITDLQYVYRIFYGHIDVAFDEFFSRSKLTSTRGNSCKLLKPALSHNLACRKNFFCNRIIDVWNSLPSDIVESKSLDIFTKKLNRVNFTKFLYFA